MVLKIVAALIIAYLIGAIPVGWLLVWLFKGKDVRTLGSGRVGGTNVMRAAGILVGLLTAVLDAGKGILVGYLASLLIADSLWVKILAVALAVVGQIYSVFLIEKNEHGGLKFRGGAGGSTTLGGAIALWPHIWIIILPLIVLVYLGIGYASITTISIAFFSMVLFSYRAINGLGPWEFGLYGFFTLVLVMIALRPNLERIKVGTERAVGLRAYFKKKLLSQKSDLAK